MSPTPTGTRRRLRELCPSVACGAAVAAIPTTGTTSTVVASATCGAAASVVTSTK